LLLRSLDVATIAAAIAAAAAVAAVAAAVATLVATRMATVAAAAAIAAVATAALAMAEGHRLAVTADEGDANDREKHRQTKNHNSIHPQILQLLTGTGK
jgi:hypothetical protein